MNSSLKWNACNSGTINASNYVAYFLFVDENYLLQYYIQWNPDFSNLQAQKNGLSYQEYQKLGSKSYDGIKSWREMVGSGFIGGVRNWVTSIYSPGWMICHWYLTLYHGTQEMGFIKILYPITHNIWEMEVTESTKQKGE